MSRICWRLRPRRNDSGQSMVETIYALPLIGGILLATLQIGLIYWAKSTLDYAAFQAARTGSLHHADTDAMKEEMVRALTPLFTVDTVGQTLGNDTIAGYNVVDSTERKEIDIAIINPTSAAFEGLAKYVTYPGGGRTTREIPNTSLIYRNESGGGMSIQDANLLKIKVTYNFRLIVPFVNTIICTFYNANLAATGSTPEDCYDSNFRLPLVSTATVRMQTPVRL